MKTNWKEVLSLFIAFLIGLIAYPLLLPVPSTADIMKKVKDYLAHTSQMDITKLTNAVMIETYRINFNGGLDQGGAEIDVEKKTGKIISIKHGDRNSQPTNAPYSQPQTVEKR